MERSTTTRQTAWPNRVPPGEGEFDCVGFVQAAEPTSAFGRRSRSRSARRSCGLRRRTTRRGAGGADAMRAVLDEART